MERGVYEDAKYEEAAVMIAREIVADGRFPRTKTEESALPLEAHWTRLETIPGPCRNIA